MTVRQEVMNVLLAQLLQERGLVAAPEQILRSIDSKLRRMPDVLVDFQGLRLAIEGEFDTTAAAAQKAEKAALERVEQGIAHIGMAVVYPKSLRYGDFKNQKERLGKETLRFAIITETQATKVQQPALFKTEKEEQPIPFMQGDLNALVDSLRRAYEQLVQDEVLERAVALIDKSIESFTSALIPQPASTERFAAALGIQELPKETAKKDEIGKEEEQEE